jgi:hypothetical protein
MTRYWPTLGLYVHKEHEKSSILRLRIWGSAEEADWVFRNLNPYYLKQSDLSDLDGKALILIPAWALADACLLDLETSVTHSTADFESPKHIFHAAFVSTHCRLKAFQG